MPDTPRTRSFSTAVLCYGSWGVILASAVLLYRVLPVHHAAEVLQQWVAAAGPWGPLVFGAVYVLACVLLIPASALTLVAGAVFGLGLGVLTVSLASIIGATLAFFIGRFLARSKVEAKARNHPTFAALDAALRRDGWKVVAMLRLSPAVPFSVQNYLLGVTGVRWGTYVLTSWVAMLPGVFMYAYLGMIGGQAAGVGPSSGRWVLLGVGLLATLALTVYVSVLAKRMLHMEVERAAAGADAPQATPTSPASEPQPRGVGWTLPSAAVLLAVLAGGVTLFGKPLAGLFGPPGVTMKESYLTNQKQPSMDHSVFNTLLTDHVDADGGVDYVGLTAKQDVLDGYLKTVAEAPFDALGRDEKLALLINGYNAATLRLLTEYQGIDSIRSIPAEQRWDDVRWVIGGTRYSLSQMEHEAIRPNFIESRVHWALVCAAVGCPPLRNEAYTATRLDEQLEGQARTVFTRDQRWFEVSPDASTIRVSAIMQWYGGDFEQTAGGVAQHVGGFDPAVKEANEAGNPPRVTFLDYDWGLNSTGNVSAATGSGVQAPGEGR